MNHPSKEGGLFVSDLYLKKITIFADKLKKIQ